MEPFTKITETEEAELKVMTTEMYKKGGTENVLSAISMMQRVELIILEKLDEILLEEIKKLGGK